MTFYRLFLKTTFYLMVIMSVIPLYAQKKTYSLTDLSQEKVQVIKEFFPITFKEIADTSFTIYSADADLNVSIYFVHGDQYDNIFNPNPTGIIINNLPYKFYCNLEKSIPQNYSNVLKMVQFSYLSKKYLMIINFRENCIADDCMYRCYNFFDITDKNHIYQISFSSVFEGEDTFGDFNNDGIVDFVRMAPKQPSGKDRGVIDHFLITVFTITDQEVVQLFKRSNKSSYYLWVEQTDETKENFKILRGDWFMSVNDSSGNILNTKPYFSQYISFNPYYRHLFSPDGIRIPKKRWSVYVTKKQILEDAQSYCRILNQKKVGNTYIMVDQYSGNIAFEVMIGNFNTKLSAIKMAEKIKRRMKLNTKVVYIRSKF